MMMYVEIYNVQLVGVLKKWLICENSRNGKIHNVVNVFEVNSGWIYTSIPLHDFAVWTILLDVVNFWDLA